MQLSKYKINGKVKKDLNRYVIPARTDAGLRKHVIPTLMRAVAWDLCFLRPSY